MARLVATGTWAGARIRAARKTGRCGYWFEKDCVFNFQGRTFEAGGAVVTPEYLIAYPRANGVLGDWHGNPIGTWRATATWLTPRSYVSCTMSQIRARLDDGAIYTGRGAGEGCIFKGKRVVFQRRKGAR